VSLCGRTQTDEIIKDEDKAEALKTENMPVLAYRFGIPTEAYGVYFGESEMG